MTSDVLFSESIKKICVREDKKASTISESNFAKIQDKAAPQTVDGSRLFELINASRKWLPRKQPFIFVSSKQDFVCKSFFCAPFSRGLVVVFWPTIPCLSGTVFGCWAQERGVRICGCYHRSQLDEPIRRWYGIGVVIRNLMQKRNIGLYWRNGPTKLSGLVHFNEDPSV